MRLEASRLVDQRFVPPLVHLQPRADEDSPLWSGNNLVWQRQPLKDWYWHCRCGRRQRLSSFVFCSQQTSCLEANNFLQDKFCAPLPLCICHRQHLASVSRLHILFAAQAVLLQHLHFIVSDAPILSEAQTLGGKGRIATATRKTHCLYSVRKDGKTSALFFQRRQRIRPWRHKAIVIYSMLPFHVFTISFATMFTIHLLEPLSEGLATILQDARKWHSTEGRPALVIFNNGIFARRDFHCMKRRE